MISGNYSLSRAFMQKKRPNFSCARAEIFAPFFAAVSVKFNDYSSDAADDEADFFVDFSAFQRVFSLFVTKRQVVSYQQAGKTLRRFRLTERKNQIFNFEVFL